MTRFVNTFALETQHISSTEIGPLGMVAHQLVQAGRYIGRVHQGKDQVAQFELLVDETPGGVQADVDLAKLVAPPGAAKRSAARFKMSREGYAIFFVSSGAGGYAVTLEALIDPKAERPETVFDSRQLGKNDLFVVTLVRPGLWSAHDRASSGRADITVTYPKIGDKAYRPSEQAKVIRVVEGGLDPKALKVGPGEGVVFQVGTEAASITVSLSKPDDGRSDKTNPPPKGKRRVRWTNPRQKTR